MIGPHRDLMIWSPGPPPAKQQEGQWVCVAPESGPFLDNGNRHSSHPSEAGYSRTIFVWPRRPHT